MLSTQPSPNLTQYSCNWQCVRGPLTEKHKSKTCIQLKLCHKAMQDHPLADFHGVGEKYIYIPERSQNYKPMCSVLKYNRVLKNVLLKLDILDHMYNTTSPMKPPPQCYFLSEHPLRD